ncbi:MAG: dual specificity protein phosphatase family protein [archaeon]|nr:dual specificity protein phosphatase family protein [archaeon]
MKKIKAQLNLRLKIPTRITEPKKPVRIIDNRKTISRIITNLYVGGSFIANDTNYLNKNQFTHVVNCSSKCTETPKDSEIKTLNLCLKDDPSADIISPLFTTIQFLEGDETPNKKILFHCIEGISRGPALMAGFMMWKFNLNKDEAISVLIAKRPCIDINFGFLVQLNKWEIFLTGSQNEDEINLFKINENIFSISEKEVPFCDNIKDMIIVRLKNFFIFVKGYETKAKKNNFINYLTNFYINYHRGQNAVSRIKTLVVNFKEFKEGKSFEEMIRKFVLEGEFPC